MTSNNSTKGQPPQPRQGYPHLFRLLHWLLAGSLPVQVATGLSLYAVCSPDWSLFAGVLPSWFPSGRMHLVHLWAAVVFFPSLLGTLWIYCRRRCRFRLTHLLLLCGGVAMVATGLLLLNPLGPPAASSIVRWIHAVVGLVVLPIAFLWHIVEGLWRYRGELVPAFHPWAHPQWMQLLCFIPLPLLTSCLILAGVPIRPPWRDLVAKRVPQGIGDWGLGIGEELLKLPWEEAPPLRIELTGGVGFHAGRTQVTLRALHDGQELFVWAEWLDPTEDRRYMPWRKTPDGWKHLLTDPDDESFYYEDKFALIFPTGPDWQFERFGCATYCHAGGGRAYGYKGSGQPVDVWHWKSTRTDPVGQVDDKYWWKVDFEAKDIGRHGDPSQRLAAAGTASQRLAAAGAAAQRLAAAGAAARGPEGGGYEKNISEDKTHPAFLPDDFSRVRDGIIPTKDAVEYTEEAAARIAAGTIIPGIVASAFAGDRGHIRCVSRHESGRWRLYIRRKLNTGSRFDVTFVPGGVHPFGCAAFDHSSKRHAYGFSVYRLVLEP